MNKLVLSLILSSSVAFAQVSSPAVKPVTPVAKPAAKEATPVVVTVSDAEKVSLLKANNASLQSLLALQQSAEYGTFIGNQNALQQLVQQVKIKYGCKEMVADYNCTK